MSRLVVFSLGAGLALIAITGLRFANSSSPETVFEAGAQPPQLAPVCPWRDPESDLKRLFPSATRWERETRILSGLRSELAQRLGRLPTGDENALQVYRIFRGAEAIGQITTRRVKGTFGAIELVLGVDAEGKIAGLLLQRLREPPPVQDALQGLERRKWLEGKRADSAWSGEELMAGLPDAARGSAEAIIEGVRSTMILLEASEPKGNKPLVQAHNH